MKNDKINETFFLRKKDIYLGERMEHIAFIIMEKKKNAIKSFTN